jgi:hypothetical protein
MRWLLIVQLVSLAALLIAAAGGARHIWLQRPGRQKPLARRKTPDPATAAAEEPGTETEIL